MISVLMKCLFSSRKVAQLLAWVLNQIFFRLLLSFNYSSYRLPTNLLFRVTYKNFNLK